VLSCDPSHLDALYYRGTVYEKLSKLKEAVADFTEVLRLDPNHVKASYARGACRNLQGEFSQAIGTPAHVAAPTPPAAITTRDPPLQCADDYVHALERDTSDSRVRRSSNLQLRDRPGSSSSSQAETLTASPAATSPRCAGTPKGTPHTRPLLPCFPPDLLPPASLINPW
jgi:tetratricopeptide (TPR) repeat protein